MVDVDVSNLTRSPVDEQGAAQLARRVLTAEGLEDGEVGVQFVPPSVVRQISLLVVAT